MAITSWNTIIITMIKGQYKLNEKKKKLQPPTNTEWKRSENKKKNVSKSCS